MKKLWDKIAKREPNLPAGARLAYSLSKELLENLEDELIRYLSFSDSKKSEKYFFENFLRGVSNEKPANIWNIKYQTWRRGDRAYNLPWVQIQRKVYDEKGLKFKRNDPD